MRDPLTGCGGSQAGDGGREYEGLSKNQWLRWRIQ